MKSRVSCHFENAKNFSFYSEKPSLLKVFQINLFLYLAQYKSMDEEEMLQFRGFSTYTYTLLTKS